ncbi:MAG: Rieske (2Fe-2S) protein [Bacteroidota bacterium]|nr:Rieske (2Fe-2S) protein [Bacteroidota bacterium]MDP4233001.1 Rieske (2Fe-2S) protein [Bacteroidota bacterium]MDP4242045.1 Rieske (2Fe-2S) protein [Bacteroidota bacterium]MDP4286948.1 Rieske (2Fe-2S) protein [Bacteroidota bacterium]
MTRRDFIVRSGTALSAGALVLPVLLNSCAPTSIPIIATQNPPPPPGPDGRVPVDVSDLSSANPMKVVPSMMGSDGMPVLVTFVGAGDYRAFSSKCTHQACQVNSTLTNGYILCACHLSHFGLDGSVLQGPASSSLLRYDGVYDAPNSQLRIKLV